MRSDGMFPLAGVLSCAVVLAGCDGETVPPSPAAYEQAKADCTPHGGLASVKHVLVLLRPDRIDATCVNGVRLSRDVKPPSNSNPGA